MRSFLAFCLGLILVLGLAAGSFAFDTQRILAPVTELQKVESSLGGLYPKDFCYIWMDQLAGWLWIWYADWFDSSCGFKKYVDPYEGYTDCDSTYFPFYVESIEIGLHAYYWPGPESLEVICDFDIEELGAWDPGLGCYTPGSVSWASGPLSFSLEPGWVGYLGISFPGFWVYGPFFVSWHLLNHPVTGYYYFGWLTDAYSGATPCWNWLDGACVGYGYLEFYNDVGYDGDLLVDVGGRPEWNVAVNMGSFQAVPGDQTVTLYWRTESEAGNASWAIKRDGEWIAELDGQGNKATATDYTYMDSRDLINGVTYSYTLEAVDYDGNVDVYGPVTATPLAVGAVPGEFALWQNYPNPFNASTVIRYELASDEHVTLKVYNIHGQEVASLVDADQRAGMYSVQWKGEGLGSGVYIYTLNAGNLSQTKKMVFVK